MAKPRPVLLLLLACAPPCCASGRAIASASRTRSARDRACYTRGSCPRRRWPGERAFFRTSSSRSRGRAASPPRAPCSNRVEHEVLRRFSALRWAKGLPCTTPQAHLQKPDVRPETAVDRARISRTTLRGCRFARQLRASRPQILSDYTGKMYTFLSSHVLQRNRIPGRYSNLGAGSSSRARLHAGKSYERSCGIDRSRAGSAIHASTYV